MNQDRSHQIPTHVILLLAAAFAITARMHDLSLESLDDAFYARKGIEMARGGLSWTVHWAGQPAWQNPPLPFWLMALSFKAFGESDFSARLPVVVMALGSVALVWRIARELGGDLVADVAMAILLATPLFLSAARGTMLEIPFAFFTCGVIWCVVAPRLRFRMVWLGLALGAAFLTKSLLALSIVVTLVSLGLLPMTRSLIGTRPVIGGTVLGLMVGATWPFALWWQWGSDAVRAHYVGEIAERALALEGPLERLAGVSLILLASFQPALLAAALGAATFIVLLKRRSPIAGAIAAFAVVPVVVALGSTARSARYLWPILPALVTVGGYWIATVYPAFAARLSRLVVPVCLSAVGGLLWVSPTTLTRDRNRIYKTAELRRHLEARGVVPYWGGTYWSTANPLLYYLETRLGVPAPSLGAALSQAGMHPERLLIVDRERVGELAASPAALQLISTPGWTLFKIEGSLTNPGSARPD